MGVNMTEPAACTIHLKQYERSRFSTSQKDLQVLASRIFGLWLT
jgi:hypothetical protein